MNALRHSFAPPADGQPARRRVLFVINSLAGGGAERVMATLLANSQSRLSGYDIMLAVLDDGPRAFDLPEWLSIVQLDCKGGMLRSLVQLDRAIADLDPHLTVSFLTRANLVSGTVMTKRRRPWIISERTSTPAHLGSPGRQLATKAMMRVVYPRATRVIAVSEGVAAKLARSAAVKPANIDVIPNPVDVAALEAAARGRSELAFDDPYVIAVGRLVSVKNYRMLVEAFAKSNLPCRLVIAGDGPERDSLREVAATLGVADRVIMPGWLTNPYPALARAAAFALSSNVEGFPNALVEAMALGVPVVATNCPDGPAEILAGRGVEEISQLTVAEAGILSPVGDADSYARALQLAFEASRRKSLVVAGRARAADYSADAITQRYWDVIERALERAGAPAAI
jgi:glycosyltransferase involved in cell wall biosynthesis